jgi:small subunit ribosomal protein S6
MTHERISTYEGLFLFPQAAMANLGEAAEFIRDVITRSGGTIVSFAKWDDRRLAYEIKGNKRGVYFLAYFTAPHTVLGEIERLCNQSEKVLRHMVLNADHIPSEVVEAAEGSADLATEIKLRAEKEADAEGVATSSIGRRDEADAAQKQEAAAEEIVEEVEEATTDA